MQGIDNSLNLLNEQITPKIQDGHEFHLDTHTYSATSFLALALHKQYPQSKIFIIVATDDEIDTIFSDLDTLSPLETQEPFLIYSKDETADIEKDGVRLRASRALHSPDGAIFVASGTSILAPIPTQPNPDTQEILEEGSDVISYEALSEKLAQIGYVRAIEVTKKGTIALRGSIIDFWPPTEPFPIRADYFGDSLDSLRYFDPATQRSQDHIHEIWLSPASEPVASTINPFSIIPKSSIFILHEHDKISTYTRKGKEDIPTQKAYEHLIRSIKNISPEKIIYTGFPSIENVPDFTTNLLPPPKSETSQTSYDGRIDARKNLLSTIQDQANSGTETYIYLDTSGSVDRLASEIGDAKNIIIKKGILSTGFTSPTLHLTILSQSDIYSTPLRLRPRSKTYSQSSGERIERAEELMPGDLVVHIDHGIGRYLGQTEVTIGNVRQEVLSIEYADNTQLQVPVAHAHLLTRYVGVSGVHVKLASLGSKRWKTDCIKAEKSVQDYAARLLEVQAKRNSNPGFAFETKLDWVDNFEAAFPYAETKDQKKSIESIKNDMAIPRPMDRLICGDAGYGKTEVAMRAAFIAVTNGKQVAVLAPTTVLAEQHYSTFKERMSAFPIRIEIVSRLRTPSARQAALAHAATGVCDILIGTHAIVEPGINFKDLGLVIIDEEQRFGVEHKERLKRLKPNVDILTLSATPIPRTLYLSMVGARDLSLLQTPPQRRLAIETHLEKDNDEIIKRVIMRELNRQGQVFFLHNRVITISLVAKRIQSLIPTARIATIHGQMASRELSQTMREFENGNIDILISTTIIAQGIDLPRANTIIIDRADRFGLADLYQLRGRVGRSTRRAYAYLLIPGMGTITEEARERLKALMRHGGLGGGLNLALRDLELRGAGNILGAEQSGHIASIGFNLYCQLLKRAVANLRGEKPPQIIDVEISFDFITLSPGEDNPTSGASIPYDYIEDDSMRMLFHRRIAETSTTQEIRSLLEELKERFGPIPPQAKRFLRLAELRTIAHEKSIARLTVQENLLRIFNRHGTLIIPPQKLKGANADQKITSVFRLLATL